MIKDNNIIRSIVIDKENYNVLKGIANKNSESFNELMRSIINDYLSNVQSVCCGLYDYINIDILRELKIGDNVPIRSAVTLEYYFGEIIDIKTPCYVNDNYLTHGSRYFLRCHIEGLKDCWAIYNSSRCMFEEYSHEERINYKTMLEHWKNSYGTSELESKNGISK